MTREDVAAGNLRGIACMLASMAFYIVADALTKSLGGVMPVGQLICLRSVAAAAVLLPYALRPSVLRHVRALASRPVLVRNLGEISFAPLYVTSLFHIPLASATAMMQTSPLFITVLAALFLGERVGWQRWTATLVGFVGALLIIRPGSTEFSWWYVPAMLAVGSVLLRDLGTRYIDRSMSTHLITFQTFVLTALTGAAMGATESWVALEWEALLRVVATGLFLVAGATMLVLALRSGGELAVVVPFRYSIVVWSILIGYLAWGELPHATSVLGIVIVVASGIYTVHREQTNRRKVEG